MIKLGIFDNKFTDITIPQLINILNNKYYRFDNVYSQLHVYLYIHRVQIHAPALKNIILSMHLF